MNSSKSINVLAKISIVAALYVVITYAIAPISYGPVQVRISEVLVLLAFFDKKYIISLTIGCLIANLLSPLGMIDVVVGTLGTFFSVYAISKTKNLFLATLWPSFFCIPVVFILHIFVGLPFMLYLFGFIIGEFLSVTIIGYPLVKIAMKNEVLLDAIKLS
ncbi:MULTISPECIES: QueT transporter family protein [Clostridium]|uniref:QueT transporter family protein n=1 Tax=Clostridium nitritogenes TaxID=83340 RepID=A0ABN1LLH9_9CLOT|nr:QueT transporter family protein [Clostridium baratii]MBT9832412.1 QueT transporter family protein [Clostridium baratii]MDU1854543.1 QueT transporter family protein [Clostridium baratii]STA99576.1 citrulline cluster-linked protein [Clostridium baratii]